MGMVKEFRDFAMKGNVVDLAVGIIIGGAFGKIVSSLVSDVIMPVIGKLTSGVDFTKLAMTIQEQTFKKNAAGEYINDKSEVVTEANRVIENALVQIKYGAFIQTVIDFIIIAFAIFMMVKVMNSLQKKEEAKPKPPPKEEVLLTEIRDLLAKQNG
jgi:large conductance mechanosensitive channel